MSFNFVQGLVVQLPDMDGIGIIVNQHRISKYIYKGTIVGSDGKLYSAKFRVQFLEIDQPIEYLDYRTLDIDTVVKIVGGLV